MSTGIYTKDVTEILDLFYAGEGHEPDWAAIKTRLYETTDSSYAVMLGLLRAFHLCYEDSASFATLLYRSKEDLPES